MQRLMDYLLALQDFLIFDVSLDINGQLHQKSKEVAYTIITLPEAKRFMFFIMSSLFLSKTGIGLKLLFSIIL